MIFFPGRSIGNIDEAIAMAVREAEVADLSARAVALFLPPQAGTRSRAEVEKLVDTEVRRKFGRNAHWRGHTWTVSVPHLRYQAVPVPQLVFTLQPYLAVGMRVLLNGDSQSFNLVGPLGKPEKLILPLEFLLAMLDDRLDEFQVTAKDGLYTTWNMPSFPEPVRLPDKLLDNLNRELQKQSVASWLLTFGAQGRSLRPQVVGSLLGMLLRLREDCRPLPEQSWKEDTVLEALTGMFGSVRAKKKLDQARPQLKGDMTNEAAIRLVLQMAGKEQ
ncbi:MAG: hypothetical protein HYX87_00310 [Chloroflexi bacterium]|nr:hypothetical protein [Chloroflexota bacterium]